MAMIDDAANLVERVVYDAYGRARHQWPLDLGGDGDVDSADDAIMDALAPSFPIAITSGSYNADADIERDGDVDADDAQAVTDALTTAALAAGQISDPAGPDNPIGYDGYVFNATDGTYTVRFRTYFPELGRWGERDPAGYVDGLSRYLFTLSNPVVNGDPTGLRTDGRYYTEIRHSKKKGVIRRHFYGPRGEYLGYFDYEESNPGEVAIADKIAADHEFLNTCSRLADGALQAGENVGQMAVAGFMIIPDPSDLVLAGVFGSKKLADMAAAGARLVKRNGKWFWRRSGKLEEVTGTAAVRLRNIEGHHELPREFRGFFAEHGLEIDDFVRPLDKSNHRLRSDGLHCVTEDRCTWNKAWDDWIRQNPDASRDKILEQLEKMRRDYYRLSE
ncbi:MAG: DUF2380 domain-containing protein [Phycisphaeraceae bacterium]|nr:DUF2380 domain-containing protein [Phycisphaeraceae bacterium]